jgi:deazaflavin-dependent oxidoreductase (nitroreductase family)
MAERQDLNDWDRQIIEEFRANGGNVGGQFAGAPLLLLTTTGAKSGEPRTHPLAYLRDAGHLYVFAGNRGAPTNPAWYHNLVAHPDVTVELGEEKLTRSRLHPTSSLVSTAVPPKVSKTRRSSAGMTRPGLLYRRRNAAPSAVVPMFHMLSATLIVTPGGTIWSMRSSRSVDRSIPSAAR